MSEFLVLDWDDQYLVGVDAIVTPKTVNLRKWLRFDWSPDDSPMVQPNAAGKRLRAELDRAEIPASDVLVSLPREAAIIRLLELPECTDDELPELVRFQAATRSSVPLDRLLLDYLPLPRLAGVEGRRVLMVTLGKPMADRIQSVLKAAGLQPVAIRLSAVGTAEVISRQTAARSADPSAATLIVTCAGLRVEITATCEHKILLMHGASLSGHDSPEAMVKQVLAEVARSTVALHQAAPGMRVGSGWVFTSATELEGLPEALEKRFGFAFQNLDNPFQTPGIRTDFDAKSARHDIAIGPIGLLLGQSGRLVESIDFLHPRRTVVKPNRRRFYQIGGAVAGVLIAGGIWGAIQHRVSQLDEQMAAEDINLATRQKALEAANPLMETAKSITDWTQHDLDWLDQFARIKEAMGGPEKLYLTSFDAKLASRDAYAMITASGRAKMRDDAEDLGDRLQDAGYQVTPKEIVEDRVDPQFPQRIDLRLDVIQLPAKTAKPDAASGKTAASASEKNGPAPSSSSTVPSTVPGTAPATAAPSASPKSAAADRESSTR